ncbi:MAG: phosphopantothenate/pantothenate synthetase [Candidatus Altiarchaeota archaeon]
MIVSKDHPRYRSLAERERLVDGFERGFVAKAGLIAHGRGEAFDYLLGEKTIPQGLEAERASVAALLLADHPVISVNGNVAALVPAETVELADALDARLEVNLFYWTNKREMKIKGVLEDVGGRDILGVGNRPYQHIPGLESARGRVDEEGIWKADCVLVPLEDGDRTEALLAMGKTVATIDLNPLSRTSQKATFSVVDNLTRAFPKMVDLAKELCKKNPEELKKVVDSFDNKKNLTDVIKIMRGQI